ncbi:MAG TPA: hypothetical protein VFX16_34680 [Pseudonocardiaceae bacterium]|nr:hypothetical protein [Pseudonocardiaceae bacterium]
MHPKLFAAGVALLIACGTPTAVNDLHQAAAVQAQQRVSARSADQLTLAHELPGTPPDVAATFVHLLAEGGQVAIDEGCLLFTMQAADEFAAANGQPTCVAAMRQLEHQVINPETYANDVTVPTTAWAQVDSTATVNGCDLTWAELFTDTPIRPPGPLPGLMVLQQLDDAGWQISGYQPC